MRLALFAGVAPFARGANPAREAAAFPQAGNSPARVARRRGRSDAQDGPGLTGFPAEPARNRDARREPGSPKPSAVLGWGPWLPARRSVRGAGRRAGARASQWLAIGVLAPACALGQTPSFRAVVRRVLVPVYVTGRKGQSVTGLTRRDFHIFVDGKPVRVRSLDWIQGAATGRVSGPGRPAPGVFANAPHAAAASWVALLIDFQNTSTDGMLWMREGVLRFLRRGLQPGSPVAIFGASRGLLLLQPFTRSRARLLAAAERWIRPRLDWNLAFSLPLAPVPSDAGERPGALPLQRPRTAWSEAEIAARQVGRFPTDAALRELAAQLAPLPGRKVVIWAGDGPPLRWRPARGLGDRNLAVVPDGEWEDRAGTYQLLNEANVELFPLDPRGIAVEMPDTNGPARKPSANRPLPRGGREQALGWPAMEQAARATGGTALAGNNDLWQLLRRAQQDWRNYYLLSFQPPADPPRQVRYHHIRVRVDRPGLTVRARRGYMTQAPQVLAAKHPRPGFATAATSPANLSGIPLRVRWGPWRRLGKWRTRQYWLDISVGGAGCHHDAPCRLRAGVVVFNARGGIIGQRGYLVKLRAGTNPAAQIRLEGRLRVQHGHAYIARFMVASRPADRFGALVLALDPPAR